MDVISVASPILAALIAVSGVVITVVSNNHRERSRLEHEQEIKQAELDAEREARLRDERIAAYRKFLAATTTAHVDRENVAMISEACAEISLLARTPELASAAMKVWVGYGSTQQIAAKAETDSESFSAADFAQALTKARDATEEFLKLARQELEMHR